MDAFQLALAQGREELLKAQQTLKEMNLRVSQLESVVTQLEALTAGAATSDSSKPNAPTLFETPRTIIATGRVVAHAGRVGIQPPLWRAIINALNGKKANFTVPEALAALERNGRRMLSPNRLNIIRNTLIQNKAFGRLSPGHYYVKGFETEIQEGK
jgi:hypothetical protein